MIGRLQTKSLFEGLFLQAIEMYRAFVCVKNKQAKKRCHLFHCEFYLHLEKKNSDDFNYIFFQHFHPFHDFVVPVTLIIQQSCNSPWFTRKHIGFFAAKISIIEKRFSQIIGSWQCCTQRLIYRTENVVATLQKGQMDVD